MPSPNATQIGSACGRILRAHRKRRKMSQTEVAAILEVTQGYVSQIENGVENPTLSIIERFAEAVGCDVDILITSRKPIVKKA